MSLTERQDMEKRVTQHLHKLSSTQLQEIVDKQSVIVTSHPPIWSWQGDCLLHWNTEHNEYVVVSSPFADQDVDLGTGIYISHFDTFMVFYHDNESLNLVMTMFDFEGVKLWEHKIYDPEEKLIIPEHPQIGKYCLLFTQEKILVYLPRINGVDLVLTKKLKRKTQDQKEKIFLTQIYPVSTRHFLTLDSGDSAQVWKIDEQDSTLLLSGSKKRFPLPGTIHVRQHYIVQEHEHKFIKLFVDETTGKLFKLKSSKSLPFDEPSYSRTKYSLSYEKIHCLYVSDESEVIPFNSELFVIADHRHEQSPQPQLYCRGQLLYSDDRLWGIPISRRGMKKEIQHWSTIIANHLNIPSCLLFVVAEYV